jgi:hypothetical protein
VVTNGDIDRFTAGAFDSFDQSGVVNREQLAGCRAGLQALAAWDSATWNAGQVVRSSRVGQANDRPQQPSSVFTPENSCTTVGLADQRCNIAGFDVGTSMPVFIDADLANADAAGPSSADLSVLQRI